MNSTFFQLTHLMLDICPSRRKIKCVKDIAYG
jgi:hypothetical protein